MFNKKTKLIKVAKKRRLFGGIIFIQIIIVIIGGGILGFKEIEKANKNILPDGTYKITILKRN